MQNFSPHVLLAHFGFLSPSLPQSASVAQGKLHRPAVVAAVPA